MDNTDNHYIINYFSIKKLPWIQESNVLIIFIFVLIRRESITRTVDIKQLYSYLS